MIIIFWHICELSNWKNVVNEQFDILKTSKLLEECDSIQIGYLGNIDNIQWLLNYSYKIKLLNTCIEKCHYERLTINSMVDFISNMTDNIKILYIHSKGVTRAPHDNSINLWREHMQYFLITKYKEILPYLDEYDAVGCTVINNGNRSQKIDNETHCLHFSGNFWWSRSEYIKKMKKLSNTPNNMKRNNTFWLCERWILHRAPDCRILEVYTTGRPHCYGVSRRELGDYTKKWNPREVNYNSGKVTYKNLS